MTTASRAYINKQYNQFVDDECLEYRSVPMAVVNTILKVKRPESDFTGVKRVFNNVPARPINLNALATSIARMGNMPYSRVDAISSRIGMEERTAVEAFVKGNKDPFLEPIAFAPQKYDPEPAPRSTTGVPLRPLSRGISKRQQAGIQGIVEQSIPREREVQLLLGDESQTYNTPPFRQPISFNVPSDEQMKNIESRMRGNTFQSMAEKQAKDIMSDFVSLPSGKNISSYLGIPQATGAGPSAGFRTAMSMEVEKSSPRTGVIYTSSRGGMRGGLKSIPDYPTEPIIQNTHTTSRMDDIFGKSHEK